MDLSELQRMIHTLATEKGWWEGAPRDKAGRVEATPSDLIVKLALIGSEVSEAIECVRRGEMATDFEPSGKPVGFATELADVVIRTLDLAGAMGINLENAIIQKHVFNKSRAYRHGGKAA